MPLTNRVTEIALDATGWRRHLHTIPETAFTETKTSSYIQEKLADMTLESVHTGWAKTGVVAVLKNGTSDKKIGLRADFDALPMPEKSGVAYASTHDGVMHACGHDGHTSMLLGAAQYLSETRNFDGTVYFYFQPAEEDGGGANVMLQEGLFDQFPPDEVYAMHNWPGLNVGTFSVTEGPVMAAPDFFTLTVTGKGGHGALPHNCIDPIVVATQILAGWQTLVSRYTDPLESIVISNTKFHSGTAFNVIPDVAELGGTVRTFNPHLREKIPELMENMATQIASAHGATVDLNYTYEYPPTVNHVTESGYAREVCASIVGANNVMSLPPSMGGEDFSYMLEKVPGCYVFVGNGDSYGLHHPQYVFNDDALAYGIDFFAKIVEARLPK